MKKFTKIFMAVVAGMFAFSCVTDATEDLGIEVGKGGGKTQITVSLEESRTQLGERDDDGKYPLSWSAGDQIAINGEVSTTLAEGGNAAATFSFGEVLATPYNIVYPASEGANVVNFLAEQPYTVGTFAPKAAPMYGYAATAGNAIELKHLTGVLRLAVKGNGEALTSVVFTSELGKIAGPFTVDCTNGALTAQEGASNTVTVTFAEPLVLGAEATPIYAAVPAGNYGTFAITLHTATDKMTVKFNSATKPVAVGMVREFKEFTYQANDVEAGGTVFEIDSKDALIEFASKVADGSFATSYTAAAVVANIDMTGVEWAPIEGFDGFTFDGGKASGYAINGLTAPLFGSTNSTISNVDLTNVNIASNGRLILGAVVCSLTEDGSLTGCHTSGTITVSNPEATIASDADLYKTIAYGGVVGHANGDITNCHNEVNITVNQVAKSDNTVVLHPSLGGIVGYSENGCVTNCVNGNEAKTTGAINYHDNQQALLYVPHVAGVAGWRAAANTTDFTGNKNYGAISYKANGAGNNGISHESINVGGVAGYTNGTAQNNDNYGTITIGVCKVKALYVGGVISVVVPSVAPVKGLVNHTGANITVNNGFEFSCLNVAGTLGGLAGGLSDANGGGLFNCSNDGAINIYGSTASDIATSSSNYYRIGGVVGYINRSVQGCENKANGDITLEGNVVLTRTNAQSGYNVGGVYAYHSTDGAHKNNTNRGDINVYTSTSKHSSATASQTTYYKMDIGGICGHVQRPAEGKEENFGHITIGKADGTKMGITANNIYIAGGVANRHNRANGVEGSVVNHGNITINSGVTLNSSTLGVYIGGCAAYSIKACDYHNYSNEGNITINGKITDLTYLGGIVAYSYGPMTNCTNTGAITTASTSEIAGAAHIGGAVGHATGNLSGVKNNAGGNVSVEGKFGEQLNLGGLTGYYGKNASDEAVLTLTSCENHGNVTLNATTNSKKATYMGGLVGEYFGTAATNCKNIGDITLIKCSSASYDTGEKDKNGKAIIQEVYANLGGFFGYVRTALTMTNCTNSGTISSANTLSSNFVFLAAGFIGGSKTDITLDNCHNSMNPGDEWGIKLENTIASGHGSNQSRAGGFLGWHSGGSLNTKNGVSNSANIYIGIKNNESGGSSYGGIAGVAPAGSFSGTISNSGNIYWAGTSHAGTFCVAGLFGQTGNNVPTVCDNLVCTGNITITREGGTNWKPTAKKNGFIAGIVGTHNVALSNAKFYGKITAIGFEDTHSTSYTNSVGAIVATNSSALLTNCHAGGTIELTTGIIEDEYNQTTEKVNLPGTLSVSNYAAYLSGDHTFTSAAAKAQKCGYISAIDATPEYAE